MDKQKKPEDMSLEELIEFRRDHKMTEEEMENQLIAIAVAESNHSSGDNSTSMETMRAVRAIDKASSK